MAFYDKTEGKLKMVGFVGSILVGLSGAAVGTWKFLKETDKQVDAKKEEQLALPDKEEKSDEEASK